MKKIGTHNSMSYLKPAKWWMWLGRFMAKCQSLSLTDQLKGGIRIFDLRIRKNDKGNWCFAHGLIEFKDMDPMGALTMINGYAKCKVRLMWETKSEDNPQEGKEFVQFCQKAEATFKNITFFGGTSISTWKNWYNFHPYGKDDPRWEFTTDQFVSSLSSFELCGLWPWLYTTLLRKKLRKKAEESTKDVVLLDFITNDELASNK